LPAILYLETNFVVGFAEGRDQATHDLLEAKASRAKDTLPFRMAIPGVCIMEAFSVLKRKRERHKSEISLLERQISEARRNRVYPDFAGLLIGHLEAARVELERIFNVYQFRLFAAVGVLSWVGEIIESPAAVILESRSKIWIDDPTDNLILATIIQHANSQPYVIKAFLTENRKDFEGKSDAKRALELANVKCFSDAGYCTAWLRAQVGT